MAPSLQAPGEEMLGGHTRGWDLLLPVALPGARAGVAIPGGPQPLFRELLAAAGSGAGKRAAT